jgi:hypothetical protein
MVSASDDAKQDHDVSPQPLPRETVSVSEMIMNVTEHTFMWVETSDKVLPSGSALDADIENLTYVITQLKTLRILLEGRRIVLGNNRPQGPNPSDFGQK